MANVNSISSNSYSSSNSIYGTRNVLSGLATGMDTEAMIENSISGYKTKLSQLQQEQDKMVWKQDAYRDIIDQLVGLNQSFTSYTSKTNLYSPAFFTQSTTTAEGGNADKLTAVGKSSSTVLLNGVQQMAREAKYSVSAEALGLAGVTGKPADWNADVSALEGSTLSLKVNGGDVTLRLGSAAYSDYEALAAGINRLLRDQKVKGADGAQVKAAVQNGALTFGTGSSADEITLTGVTGALNKLGSISENVLSLDPKQEKALTQSLGEALSGASFTVTLDGAAKTVTLGDLSASEDLQKDFTDQLNAQLKDKFGTYQDAKGNTVAKLRAEVDETGALSFSRPNNSTLRLQADSAAVGKALGIADGVTSYVQTSRTLGDLMGSRWTAGDEKQDLVINGVTVGSFGKDDALETVLNTINRSDAGVSVSFSTLSGEFTFSGKETGSASKIEFGAGLAAKLFEPRQSTRTLEEVFGEDFDWDENGEALLSTLHKSGSSATLKRFKKTDTLESLMEAMRGSGKAPNAAYDSAAHQYTVTLGNGSTLAQENLDDFKIINAMGSGAVGFSALFTNDGAGQAGQDAILSANINGRNMTLVRASNTVELDGLTVTVKDAFGEIPAEGLGSASQDAVSFKAAANTDAILEGITSFVNQFNTTVKSLHDAFATQPAEKNSSTHAKYEPLTEEDKADMSETAIQKYEEKAKQGILYQDSDISSLYTKLVRAVSTGGNAAALREVGITTTYSGGVTTLTISDESKLRAALDSDAQKVGEIFTKASADGGSNSGLMQTVKDTLESYASTSVATPGILVRQAGTTRSSPSLLNNNMQKMIQRNQEKITAWQEKMSDRIDFYTRQFTQLEKLMSTMNNQSSMLAGMMGY